MVYFAFLAGIFFADADKGADTGRSQRRKHRTPDLRAGKPDPTRAARLPVGPHPDQIPNPFQD
jgi:hypothetical protein